MLDSQSIYYDIIYNAVTCEAVSCDEPGVIADESAFRAAVMADLTVNSSVLSNSQTNAQSCVDNANGSPQIYKDIMYHFLTTIESPKVGFKLKLFDYTVSTTHSQRETRQSQLECRLILPSG